VNHEEAREQLAEHLLGTLEGPGDLEVRRHLRACSSCRVEMAALSEGVSTFALAAHVKDAPEELKDRVLTVLQEEWRDERDVLVEGTKRRFRPWLASAAAMIALVASVGWGVSANHRASGYEAAAGKYQAFLSALGGEAVRVGTLKSAGSQTMDGSVVLYDSDVGQSWALVLVRAPGLQGTADVTLSSSSGRTISMHPLDFSQWGEASTWLVTSSSLKPFNRLEVRSSDGALLATASVSS
jgi:anti-sigma factor RsiW